MTPALDLVARFDKLRRGVRRTDGRRLDLRDPDDDVDLEAPQCQLLWTAQNRQARTNRDLYAVAFLGEGRDADGRRVDAVGQTSDEDRGLSASLITVSQCQLSTDSQARHSRG